MKVVKDIKAIVKHGNGLVLVLLLLTSVIAILVLCQGLFIFTGGEISLYVRLLAVTCSIYTFYGIHCIYKWVSDHAPRD